MRVPVLSSCLSFMGRRRLLLALAAVAGIAQAGPATAQPTRWAPTDALIVVDTHMQDADYEIRSRILLAALVAALGPETTVTLSRSITLREGWSDADAEDRSRCNDRTAMARVMHVEPPECGPFDNSREGVLGLLPRVSLAMEGGPIDPARMAPQGDIHELLSAEGPVSSLDLTPRLFVLASLEDGGARGTQIVTTEVAERRTPVARSHLLIIQRSIERRDPDRRWARSNVDDESDVDDGSDVESLLMMMYGEDPAGQMARDPSVQAFASMTVIDLRHRREEELRELCNAVRTVTGRECGVAASDTDALSVDRLRPGDRLLAWTPDGPTTTEGLSAAPPLVQGDQRLMAAAVPADCEEPCAAQIHAVRGPVHAVLLPAHFARLSMEMVEEELQHGWFVIQLSATEGSPFAPLDGNQYELHPMLDGVDVAWRRQGEDRVRVDLRPLRPGPHQVRVVLAAARFDNTQELEHSFQIPYDVGTLVAGGEERCVRMPFQTTSWERPAGPVVARARPAGDDTVVCLRMPLLEVRQASSWPTTVELGRPGQPTQRLVVTATLVPRLWIPGVPLLAGVLALWLWLVLRDRRRRFQPRATHVAWSHVKEAGFREGSGAVWVARPVAALARDTGPDQPGEILPETSLRLRLEGPAVRIVSDGPVVHVPRTGAPYLARSARVLAGDVVVEHGHSYVFLDPESAARVSNGALALSRPDDSIVEKTEGALEMVDGSAEPSPRRVRTMLALLALGAGTVTAITAAAVHGLVPQAQTPGPFVAMLLGILAGCAAIFSRLAYPAARIVPRDRGG